MNEYEADRCSAKLAGANNAAAALINVEIKARFLSSCFWVNIHQQAADQPEPPNNTYSLMLSTLNGPIAEDQTQAWLQKALTQQTDYVDTHPCLSDRLSALGYSTVQSSALPQLSERQTSAAEHLLGNRVNDFAIAFDQTWQTTASTSWRQRYAYLQEAKDQLQALERKAQQAPLSIQEKWERAAYIWELQGDDAALPLLQEVIGLAPDHASANYTIGQVLLNKGDDAGIGYIETAIAQRIDWRIKGYQLIAQFFWQQGQTKAAETYRKKADQHYQQLLKAEEERTNVSHQDTFKPHTLTPSEINDLKQQLATHPQVRAAYLVEKVVTHFPEERFCVLGVIRKQQLIESTEAPQQVVDLLVNHVQTPVQTYIVILNHGSFKKLKQKISQIDQSLIFKR
jgi:tetratricopeptide (TPR) repeat protein